MASTAFAVYSEVGPLGHHRIDRVLEWTREAHERLLGGDLDRIAIVKDYGPQVSEIRARLGHFEQPAVQPAQAIPPSKAVGR